MKCVLLFGSAIQDYSDYGASTQSANPNAQNGFADSFDAWWSEWSEITDPDLNHPKGRHPMLFTFMVEGDRGAGAWVNSGREGYGRWEEKGWEAGFPKWRELREKKKNFTIIA